VTPGAVPPPRPPEGAGSRRGAGVRLQVVSAWNDPTDPTVWSGTVRSLLAELGALGALGDPGYRDATPWNAAIRLARALLRRTGRLSEAWVLTPEMRVVTQVYAWRQRLDRQPGADGFLLPGASLGRPVRRPYATWCDMSPAQIWAAHPEQTPSFGYPETSARNLRAVLRSQVRAHRAAEHCLVVSHWAADSLVRDHGIPPGRVHVVGAGRNVTLEEADRDWSTPRFLFVGNSWERKNGPALLRAFAQVRTRHPTAELHVVGRHPPVSGPGVTGHGELSFARPEQRRRLEGLFRLATCLVVPSLIEPFGIVYVEAGTAGLPSIGTTVGGAATAVGPGGVLVDPRDPAALVEAMARLAVPDEARRLGAAARVHACAFTWRACAERVVRAFAPDQADRAGLAAFL
jgi:glycosyltransferase involved in cell wall biosynthesis